MMEVTPRPLPLLAFSRGVIGVAVVILATAYDKSLWLASSEPRWLLLHAGVLVAATVYLGAHCNSGLWVDRHQPWPVWLAFVLALSALASMIQTLDPLRGWWALKHWLSCLVLFFLVVALRSERWYRTLAWLIVLPLGFNGLLGLLQFHGIDDQRVASFIGAWARLGPVIDHFHQMALPAATFINKNVAASYLVLTVPIAFAVFLTSRHRPAQVLAFLCFTLGATMLIYTRTRSSWLGAAICIGVFGIAAVRNRSVRTLLRNSSSRAHRGMVAAALALIVIAGSAPSHAPGDRLGRGVGEQLGTLFDVDQSTYRQRWANNLNSLKMAMDHPLNGVGLGAFRTVYPLYHNAWVEPPRRSYDVDVRWDHLHNDWLQAFVEMGVLGGVALIGFFVSVIALAWRTSVGGASDSARIMSLFAGIGIAGLCIEAVANFPLQTPSAALVFCLAGMVTGLAARNDAADRAASQVGPRVIGRWVQSLTLLALLASVLIARDDLRRWESGRHLATASRLNRGNGDVGMALTAIDRAFSIYPLDAVVQETRAITYARDGGGRWVSPLRIIEVVEESLQTDPNSSYLLIVLGKLYSHQGVVALDRGDSPRSAAYAEKLTTVLNALRRVESRRAEVPAFSAYAALLNAEPDRAITLFDAALKINPTDPFVWWGVDRAKMYAARREAPGGAPGLR